MVPAPFSKPGCVLFVHLRQYRGENRRQAVINTTMLTWTPGATTDIEQKLLYAQDGARCSFDIKHGLELLVLEGSIADHRGEYGVHTWLRLPRIATDRPFFSERGCTFYLRLS